MYTKLYVSRISLNVIIKRFQYSFEQEFYSNRSSLNAK